MPAAKPVTFISRYERFKLVRKPEIDQHVAGIGRQVLQKPVRYQFAVNRLEVQPGKDVLKDGMDWLADGEDTDKERDAVEALKAHREFGRDFWLEGHPPGTLYPRPVDFRKELQEAIGQLNEGRVREMLEEERSSHGRIELLNEAENALGVIGQAIQAIEDHKAQQESEQKQAKPPESKGK